MNQAILRQSNKHALEVFGFLLRAGQTKLALREILQQLRIIRLLHKRAKYQRFWKRVMAKQMDLSKDIATMGDAATNVLFDYIVADLQVEEE